MDHVGLWCTVWPGGAVAWAERSIVAGVWSDFATIAGSASGALTGLLFVAVSINRDRVTAHPALRSQAGQTLVLFLLPLIISIVLVVPGTPHWVLGLELVAVAVVAA